MQLDLYIDTSARRFVTDLSGSKGFDLPRFTQGDVLTMRIRCLTPTGTFPLIYAPIQTTGRTLQLAIGDRQGNHLTEQYTWTPGGTTADPYFAADVSLNTSAINTALTSVDTVSSLLQINLVEGTARTVFLGSVTLEGSVIKNTALTVPAGLTPASMEAVLALLRDITCNSVTINSPDGTHSRRLWEDNDGTPHDDQS